MSAGRGMSPPHPLLLCVSNPGDGEALRGMLAREGYRVDSVCTASEALQQVGQQRYEAALLDIGSPDGDGAWAVQAMLELDATLPLLVFTSDAAIQDSVLSHLAGVHASLTKPYNSSEVLAAVRRAVAHTNLENGVGCVQRTLQQSDARFRAVVETAPDAIVLADANGNIISWNKAAHTLFGYAESEVLGKPLTLLMPARYHAAHQRGLEWIRSTGESRLIGKTVELHAQRKDGSEFPIELSLATWYTDGARSYSSIIRDVTARRQAQEERDRFFNLSLDMLCIAGTDGYFKRINPAFEKTLGYTTAELLSRPFFEFVHPEDRARTAEALQQLVEGQIVIDFENRYVCEDGSYRWIQWRATPVSGTNLINAAARDVTERKRAEEVRRESEERFRQMAENIREVFWMTTPDKGEMLYVSPAYEEIWGRTCHSLYKEPRSWLDAIHPEDRARVMAAAHEKQVGGAYDEEYRIVRPDGAVRWIRDRGFPVTDHTGQVYRIAGIAEDITGRKRAEEFLRERERELRRLLEEREQMSRDLHDGIIQSIYAIGLGLDECRRLIHHDATASAERVRAAIANLNLVIRDIRHYLTGPQPMKMNGQEFKSAMTSLVEQMGHTRMPRFSLNIDEVAAGQVTPEEAPHLLYIAREAMSNCLRHSRARRALVSLQTHDGRIRLQVEDDGVGFEVQAADTRGYGLRNIEARAVMMHAQLHIESERGRGTRVVLHVPKERRGVSAQTPTCG